MFIPFEERIYGFIVKVVVRFVFMIPAAGFYFLVYLGRRIRSWHVAGRALSWPAADATVYGTYELDENEVSFSLNSWGEEELETKNYHARWAVALQYGYEAAGVFHCGTYFLPATYSDGDVGSQAEQAWAGKTIVVRYTLPTPASRSFLNRMALPASLTFPGCSLISHT